MQKCHARFTLGKVGPGICNRQVTRICQFSISSRKVQDEPQSLQDRQENFTNQLERHFRRPASNRNFRPPTVDARDLAAVPNPSPKPPGKSISERLPAKRAPLDARNLGAQRSSNGPRILKTNRETQDGQGPRMLPRRDASDKRYQGGTSNAQHNRSRGQTNETRPPRARAEGTRKRSAAPRLSNNRDDENQPERFDEVLEKESEYLKTRNNFTMYDEITFGGGGVGHTRPYQISTYTPTEPTVDSLRGMGPSLACGEFGLSETVGERMVQVNRKQDKYDDRIEELARKWGEGEFCLFKSKAEREDTLKTVQRNLAGVGDNAALNEEEEKAKMALVDTRMREETGKLATRLLKGEYSIEPLGKGPTAELLERYTKKNETYLPKDGQALAGKIGTLVALKTASSPAGSIRR